jgi:hypothetical protein
VADVEASAPAAFTARQADRLRRAADALDQGRRDAAADVLRDLLEGPLGG